MPKLHSNNLLALYIHEEVSGEDKHVISRTSFACLFLSIILVLYKVLALDGVTQWIECWPVNCKFGGSIPGQSTCLG